MSLTSFIKGSKEYRDLIRNNFIKPKFSAGPLLADPKRLNYGLVGTAFDYLLRFKIERENKCETTPWVASRLEHYSLEGKIISEARSLLSLYLKTGKMTDALKESALKLATIDNVVRSGQGADQIGIIDPLDLADLTNLYGLIDAGKFKSKQFCYLNPTFGMALELVNGADADLIIDDALIDIKTTIKPDFTRPYFEQLIGYYLLHVIDCEHRNVPVSIRKLSIYFSRQGCLFLMNMDELIDASKLPNIVAAFRDLLLIAVPRKLSTAEEARKASILKVKAKAERKRNNEQNDARRMAWERSELDWIAPWNKAKEAGINAIEENPSISRDDLTKIITQKISEFYVPERDAIPSWILNEQIFTFPTKTPSEVLYEKTVRVAKAIVAQYKKTHLSVAEKETIKEKRKVSLARKKLSEQIAACWVLAEQTGKKAKDSNHLLREEDLAKIICEDVKNQLIQINCPQAVAESTKIDGFGLWSKPRLLEAESARLSKLIIATFKRKQTRKSRMEIADAP